MNELFSAREARDEGIDGVTGNAGKTFREAVTAYVTGLHGGMTMTGEDIKLACTAKGIVPHHHNAWGGTIMGLIRKDVLEKTGRYTQTTGEVSHARAIQILMRSY